jgi:hypothetical protein
VAVGDGSIVGVVSGEGVCVDVAVAVSVGPVVGVGESKGIEVGEGVNVGAGVLNSTTTNVGVGIGLEPTRGRSLKPQASKVMVREKKARSRFIINKGHCSPSRRFRHVLG